MGGEDPPRSKIKNKWSWAKFSNGSFEPEKIGLISDFSDLDSEKFKGEILIEDKRNMSFNCPTKLFSGNDFGLIEATMKFYRTGITPSTLPHI